MPKDLKEEFLKARLNRAQAEIKQVLDKHQLLLSAELQYMQGGIIPVVKLVERNQMSDENQAEQPAVEQAPQVEPAAEVAAE